MAHSPPVGGFEEVGGARLFVDRRGTGRLTVVFLPGAGLAGLDYWRVHERVPDGASSVIYDRAGTGFSERVRLPRSSRAVTDELQHVLGDTPSKAILVGHSLGGLYARHFAVRFPERVAGVVLLDPGHEDYDASMPAELRRSWASSALFCVSTIAVDLALATTPTSLLFERIPVIRGYREAYRTAFAAEMADWPSGLRDLLVERHASLDWLVVGLRETRKLGRLYDEIRAAGSFPSVPVILLCSVGRDRFREVMSPGEPPDRVRAEIEARRQLYACFAASVPLGEVREIDSGHVDMPFRRVDAVVEAIRSVAVHAIG